MSEFELIKFGNDEQLAQAVAKRWLEQLPATGTFSVALSGGRIARKFCLATAQIPGSSGKLRTVHFFWGDERCVPPNDAESNFRIAQELLFEPLSIPGSQVHRIRGEAPPEEAAQSAHAELSATVPANEANQPIIDLVFLGMGEDGHVASLFPGEPQEMVNNAAVYRPVNAVKPPPRRITLGYRAIFAARMVWVLASGAGKEKALAESISPGGNTPLARVLKNRAKTSIFTDIGI